MKSVFFIAMALLITILISACYARHYPAKTITGKAKAPVKDYSSKTSSENAASNKPVENAATGNTIKNAADGNSTNNDAASKSIVIDHTCIKLDQIPFEWIDKAKKSLHIAYGHTSHGSQITCGLIELTKFKNSPYIYKPGSEGSLDLRDNPFGRSMDLGNPNNKEWAAETRKYLQNNGDTNVVIWSWCGQVSNVNQRYIKNYLDLMQALEKEFPGVTFVYMTGHLDGSGENGNLAKNNRQIREFCISNGKVLYDFADIESYNPDGVYFGDKYANDACDYDSNNDKKPDNNWAKEWQEAHKEGVDWYQCTAAHSQPVNGNMKAYAAWHLMARIAGWDGVISAASK